MESQLEGFLNLLGEAERAGGRVLHEQYYDSSLTTASGERVGQALTAVLLVATDGTFRAGAVY